MPEETAYDGAFRGYLGEVEFDLLLGDVRSLKQKRSVVRPVIADLRKLQVAVTEAGAHDLHRRAVVTVAAVAPDGEHLRDVLDACERAVERHPEFEVLAVRRRFFGPND